MVQLHVKALIALVDTEAQHGLIGHNTLQRHDRVLQERHGVQVQWTSEHGGSVHGVCGQEASTKICYIPIRLGGKSGVLRVQVLPGDVPMLLPAYLLADLKAVIDMKSCAIMFVKIGVCLQMTRQPTGYVSMNVCDFGDRRFHVPASHAFSNSQVWSLEAIPDWATLDLLDGQAMPFAGPLAALAAAALHLHFHAGPSMHAGGSDR